MCVCVCCMHTYMSVYVCLHVILCVHVCILGESDPALSA